MVGTDVALNALERSIPGGEVIKQGCIKLEVINMDTPHLSDRSSRKAQ